MANSSVQLWIEPSQRGRVMGLYMLVFTGGTPLGGPLVGWLTATYGPRVGMALCGIVPLIAAVAIGALLAHSTPTEPIVPATVAVLAISANRLHLAAVARNRSRNNTGPAAGEPPHLTGSWRQPLGPPPPPPTSTSPVLS